MPVTKTPRGWKIANTPGYSKTKAAAQARLIAIKMSQKKGDKSS